MSEERSTKSRDYQQFLGGREAMDNEHLSKALNAAMEIIIVLLPVAKAWRALSKNAVHTELDKAIETADKISKGDV